MDIKDMEFFRLEDRMLFEAAAAANIVAAADAAQNAGDDGNNNEEKNNNDLNVALFVAPEANADNTENTDVAAVADIDAQAKDIVEGALPTMDDANAVIPAAAADIDANAEVDAHHDFVEGTLHVDNADSFTVDANDADADADHDILGDWLANEDIDANADDVSVDGAVAAIAAEHTAIDIDADADADDANSDDFDAATRAGNHDLSLDFTAQKAYDGTNDVENGELQLNATLDGTELSVNGIYNNDTWTFSFRDDANNNYMVMVQDVTFDGTTIDTNSITIGSFTIDGGNLNDVDVIVNGEELVQTRAAENLRADGVIDQRNVTIKVRDAHMQYGDDETRLNNQYEITAGGLVDGDNIWTSDYVLSPELDAYRTDSGNIQYSPTPYADAITFSTDTMILDDHGNDVTPNYNITFESGSLTVTQRVLSVTIKDYTVTYGADLGETPDYVDAEGNPTVGYTFDGNALAEGDTLTITVGYNIPDTELSSAGFVSAGSHSGMLVEASHVLSNAENYIYGVNAGKLIVDAKGIEVSYKALDKEYDNTTVAHRDEDAGFIFSEEIFEGDIVRIFDNNVQYAFAQSDVGTDIEVVAAGNFRIVGKDASSYDIHINLISEADITPKDVEITFSADNKVYDGNTDAALTGVNIEGVINDGDVTIDMDQMTYAFSDKNVGDDKTVTAEGYKDELLGGDKLQNYNVTFVDTALANITPLTIEIGFTADNKVYDGNTDATRVDLIMDQVLEGDDVQFNDEGIQYNFSDKNVGDDKTVTAEGYKASMLSGNDRQNYDVTFVDTALADITPLAIEIGFTANTKVYDGTTEATRDQLVMDAVLEGDDLQFDDSALTYNFSDKNVGDGKTVTAEGYKASMLSGNDLQNYNVTFVDTALANITPLAIEIGFTANNKVYDGNTEATRDELVMTEVLEGDDVQFNDEGIQYNFSDKNVGDGKTVTAEGYKASMLSGDDLQNYDVTFVDTALANITPLAIEIGFTADNKVYDGNTDATRVDLIMDQVLEGDDVQFNDEGIQYNFSDKNVGDGKTVTAEGYKASMLSGDDLQNYDVTFVDTALADITPLAIEIGFTANNKVYDGNTEATRDQLVMDAVLEGDDVQFDDSALTYNFSDKNVGDGKTVTAEGYKASMLSGDDLQNYDVTFVDTALANITPLAIEIGFTADNKVYDGNTDATRVDLIMDQVLEGDDVQFDDSALTYNFSDKNVGDGKTVTAEGYKASMLSGDDLQNYDVTFVDTALANITPLAIEIGFTANNKVYDGNTEATRDQLVMDAVLEGDDVQFNDEGIQYNFSDKNVGDGKTVTAEGYKASMLSGDDLQNYDVTFVDTALANITPLSIEIGFTAADKKYDGNTIAERVDLIMDEVLEGDDVQFDDSDMEYNFDTKEPGENKTVTATGFKDSMLSGNDLANYDITFIDTTTADITYLSITVIADDKTMIYGDANPALTYAYDGDLAEGHTIAVELNLDIDASNITDSDHIMAGEYADSITAVATIYDADGNDITGDYTIDYDFGNLTVTKRNITVTAQPQEMTYGDDMPDLTVDGAYSFDANALAEGDTLDVTLGYDITDKDLSTSGNVTAGLHSGMVVEDSHILSNEDNYNYTFNNASLNVLKRDVTVSFNAENKVYDGNADATRDGEFELDGFVDGDVVRVFDTKVTYAFSDKNVGDDKTVTASGDIITVGDDVDNYTFTFDNTAEANITPLAINISFTAADKVYDGNTTAERVDLIMDEVLEGDDVQFDDSALEYNFSDKNVGEDKTVTATGYDEDALSGNDLQNYDITFVDTTTADIMKLAIEIGFTANNKVYDGNDVATRDQLVMDEVLEGDDVQFDDSALEYNFSDKNVGEGKTVTAAEFNDGMLSGKDLQNYDITFVDTALADITPLAIEIGFTANDKIYDGNKVATRDQLVMDEVLEGDDVQFDDSALEYNFSDKNVGEDKTVTAEGFKASLLSGNDLQNYDVTFVDTALADIAPLAINIGFTAADKKYDGNTIAERVDLIMDEVLEGDDVSFDDSGIEYNFDTKEPGVDKTVKGTGFEDSMLSGNDLANYDITFIDTTTADITYLTITVIADDKTMIYGDANPALTYYYEGDLAEGHMISVDLNLVIDAENITDSDHIKVGEYVDSITAVATVYDDNGDVVTGDYDIIYDFGNLTVTKRNITVTAQPQEMTYGDEMPELAGQYTFDENALASGDTLDVTLAYEITDKDVSTSGNVTAGLHSGMVVEDSHVLSNDENYNYTFNNASLDVLKRDVTVVFDAKDKVYDGNTDAEREGDFVLDGFVDGDSVTVFDTKVTYAFEDKNVGEDKTVTATGELITVGDDVDNYNFTFDNTAEANITPKPIEISFTADNKVYDGNKDATRVDLIMDQVLEGDDVQFDDEGIQYTFSDKNAGEDKTVTAEGYQESMLSGDDLANYDITFVETTTADITKLAIEIGFTADNKVYDGQKDDTRDELVMDAVLEGDDVQFNDEGIQYNFSDKNVGEGKTVTADGFDPDTMLSGDDLANYDITFIPTAEADITPKAIEISFTAEDKEYDGTTKATRDKLLLDDVIEGDDVQFDDTGIEYNFDNKNIGEAKTVTATGFNPTTMLSGDDLQNYDITFTESVFIDTTTAAITPKHITVTADDKTMTYGDAEPALTYSFDDSTLVAGDMIDVILSLNVADSSRTDSGHIKADEYVDVISATAVVYDTDGNLVTGNYEIEYVLGNLTVDLRNITVTAKPQEIIYGDDLPDLSGQYTFDDNALAKGDSLEVSLGYDITDELKSSSGNVIAGLHPEKVIEEGHVLTNGENYNYNFNAASLNVTPKDITVSFKAEDKDYDGTTDAKRDGDFIIDGVVNGDDVRAFDTNLTYAFDAPNVLRDADGNVLDRTVTADGKLITVGNDAGNYNITFNNTTEAKINPLELTVKAIDKSMTYGDENPDLTGQYEVEGLLEIDTLEVTLDYDYDNIPTSDSGHFKAGEHNDAIIEASHTLTNAESYDYTFEAADLTVDKRPITITAEDKEITYGDEVGELPYTITGEVADGDSTDGTTLAVDGEENDNGHYNAGEYDIIIGELSLDENDYEITYEPATLIVNQKEITVIADDKTKEERKPDPRLTYTVDGLLDDDKLSGRLTREPGEAPGEYEIQQGTLTSDDNYIITYIPGTLTITEKPEEPETPPPPRNIYQEPEQSNRNYNGPADFELVDYRPIIPDIHPKWDFRSRFDDHRVDQLANSQDLWMDIDSLDTLLVSKVISASNSANERGFSSGNEMFPNDTQTPINSVTPSDDFDAPLIDYIDIHGSNDADMPWIFMDESIQIPKFLEQDIADDATEDADMLDSLADVRLDEMSKHAAFKSDVELLLDGLMA